jgi:hypothetical protein
VELVGRGGLLGGVRLRYRGAARFTHVSIVGRLPAQLLREGVG